MTSASTPVWVESSNKQQEPKYKKKIQSSFLINNQLGLSTAYLSSCLSKTFHLTLSFLLMLMELG